MPHPDTVVGRLAERPRNVDRLAALRGPSRRWNDFRLKEWVGFTLFHPELFSSMIIQDAKYLGSAEFYVHELSTGALHEHAANARRSALALPTELLYGGACVFEASGFALHYDFDTDAGRHRIRVDIAATPKAAAISGELTLDAGAASAPLVVDARLGSRAAMFTHKRIYPASGTVTVGERSYRFDPERDFAIIDEHRSRLPYRTDWTWGTLAFRSETGEIVGANLAEREQPPGEEGESCIWVSGAAEPLDDVTFAPLSADRLGPWRVQSADGRVDVTFAPEGRKDVHQNFGIIAIDYFQLYGGYEGEVAGVPVGGVHGVIEKMKMRT